MLDLKPVISYDGNISQNANAKIWLTHHSHMIVTKAKVMLERGVVVKDGETETS